MKSHLHHVTYVPAKFELQLPIVKKVHLQENRLFDIYSKVKALNATRNYGQYPLHHVTYAPAKVDAATSNG